MNKKELIRRNLTIVIIILFLFLAFPQSIIGKVTKGEKVEEININYLMDIYANYNKRFFNHILENQIENVEYISTSNDCDCYKNLNNSVANNQYSITCIILYFYLQILKLKIDIARNFMKSIGLDEKQAEFLILLYFFNRIYRLGSFGDQFDCWWYPSS